MSFDATKKVFSSLDASPGISKKSSSWDDVRVTAGPSKPISLDHPNGDSERVRFTHGIKCPVCGGCEEDPRGEGKRCWGFTAGGYAHCVRPEYGAGCDYHPISETFSHILRGRCKCGVEHGPIEAVSNGKPIGEIECVYPYHDADGKVIHETVRYRLPNGDKDFKQRRPDGKGGHIWNLKGVVPVLYHLPEILAADLNEPVWIVEGEKDADNLIRIGLLATTNPMGATKWKSAYSEILSGRICRIIPDNDPPEPKYPIGKGRWHAHQVRDSLAGKAASIKIVELPDLPPKGDVSDWLAAGGTARKLEAIAEQVTVKILSDEPIVKRDGQTWVACLRNSEIWLLTQDYAKTIRYDTFRQTIQVQDKLLSDELVISLTSKIENDKRTAWHQDHIRSALINIAHQNQFSSLTEWFNGLHKWDGVSRIDTFFNEAYMIAHSLYAAECAKILFLSGVARAFEPGCQADIMVVLIGPQGLGKSRGIATLCPYPSWYADDLGCDLFEGKAGEGLQGKWIFEFSEFARVNRATLETVKSFVSRRTDHYRPPYGRVSKDFDRQCIFIGTTNDPQPLRDAENRRFLPIECVRADIPWILGNREQLWSEALARYERKESWWTVDPALQAECVRIQEESRSDDAWEAILREKLAGHNRTTVKDAAEKLDIKIDRLDRATQTRIGIVLRSIGFIGRRETTGDRLRYYERAVSTVTSNTF